MKIRSASGMLAKLLEIVARAVSARSTVALLQAILFEAKDGVLTMKATDSEISISLSAEAAVEEEGRAAIPAKLLLQYAKSLPEGEAELAANEADSTATLSSGGSSVSLRCYPPQDFPVLPDFPADGQTGGDTAGGNAKGRAFSVDAAALSEAVGKVLPFVSKDQSRPVLTGVLVAFSEGSVTMVATDSYRLGVNRQKLRGAVEGAPAAVLPGRALKEAARLAGLVGEEGTVEVALTENHAMFRAKGLTLATRLIDGDYPEYERLLPSGFAETFSVERNVLLTALKRARILAGTQSPPPPVKLAFSHESGTLGTGELTVSLAAAQTGAATEVLPAAVPEGKTFAACFNPDFLADAAASIAGENVALRFNDPLKPAVLRSSADLENDAEEVGGHLALIMPMRDPSQGGS